VSDNETGNTRIM